MLMRVGKGKTAPCAFNSACAAACCELAAIVSTTTAARNTLRIMVPPWRDLVRRLCTVSYGCEAPWNYVP